MNEQQAEQWTGHTGHRAEQEGSEHRPEQRASEQRPEQRASEQRASEQRASEQRASEQRASEQRPEREGEQSSSQPRPNQREGSLSRMVEQQTAKIPSSVLLTAALGSIAASAALQFTGRPRWSRFVGMWAPTLLVTGVYNKLVKTFGPA